MSPSPAPERTWGSPNKVGVDDPRAGKAAEWGSPPRNFRCPSSGLVGEGTPKNRHWVIGDMPPLAGGLRRLWPARAFQHAIDDIRVFPYRPPECASLSADDPVVAHSKALEISAGGNVRIPPGTLSGRLFPAKPDIARNKRRR